MSRHVWLSSPISNPSGHSQYADPTEQIQDWIFLRSWCPHQETWLLRFDQMSTCVDALVAAAEFSICAFVRVLAIALNTKWCNDDVGEKGKGWSWWCFIVMMLIMMTKPMTTILMFSNLLVERKSGGTGAMMGTGGVHAQMGTVAVVWGDSLFHPCVRACGFVNTGEILIFIKSPAAHSSTSSHFFQSGPKTKPSGHIQNTLKHPP